jgi:hypothetical protein
VEQKKILKTFENFIINESIRWYNKGKFSEEEKGKKTTRDFKIGDFIKLKKDHFRYFWKDIDPRQEYNIRNKGHWENGGYVKGTLKIKNIDYVIDVEGYEGQIIQIEGYWPWYKADDFELEI